MHITSLYIHIPFCLKKCVYCDFFSVPYDESLSVRYIDAVLRELELRRDSLGRAETVYIGGGTPTALPASDIARLLTKIADSVGTAPGAEVTTEANPGTIDQEKIRMLSDAGITRVSIGAQSFSDRELKLLGRIHTTEDTLKAVASVRDAGINNISLDLIYGIPGQTEEDWHRNLSTAADLSPRHISSYELTPEKDTHLFGMISEGRIAKPDEEIIINMYYAAIDRLALSGYRHYEISNFAFPGFECRHNLNYWNRGQYIGLGAGAHSFIRDRRTRNLPDIENYIRQVTAGTLPVDDDSEILCIDALKEYVFLGLRKTEGLNIREFREELALDIEGPSEELIRQGYLAEENGRIRLTRKGLPVSNRVIGGLLDSLRFF